MLGAHISEFSASGAKHPHSTRGLNERRRKSPVTRERHRDPLPRAGVARTARGTRHRGAAMTPQPTRACPEAVSLSPAACVVQPGQFPSEAEGRHGDPPVSPRLGTSGRPGVRASDPTTRASVWIGTPSKTFPSRALRHDRCTHMAPRDFRRAEASEPSESPKVDGCPKGNPLAGERPPAGSLPFFHRRSTGRFVVA